MVWGTSRVYCVVVCAVIKNASSPMVGLLLPRVSFKMDPHTFPYLSFQRDLAIAHAITGSVWMAY